MGMYVAEILSHTWILNYEADKNPLDDYESTWEADGYKSGRSQHTSSLNYKTVQFCSSSDYFPGVAPYLSRAILSICLPF